MYQHRSGPGSGSSSHDATSPAGPVGKRSLVESIAPAPVVQAAPSQALLQAGADLAGPDAGAGPAGPAAADPAATAATAAAGVEGASGRLPHHDRIQAAFGRHDLSGVSVASDAAAAGASAELGARAYAFGNRIALPEADLRTEAHEAAHVVQQRAGRVAAHGTAGDAHEQHADAVADRVVAGEPAADLLDEMAGPGGAGGGGGDLDGEHVQLFTTKQANITANWGYQVSIWAPMGGQKYRTDKTFGALRLALQAYEAGATIKTAEGVLNATTTFLAEFDRLRPSEKGNADRVTNQAKTLLDQAHAELHQLMKTVATTPVEGRTPANLVDDAVGQLGNNDENRRDRKRILRHEQKLGMKATEMGDVADAHGPAIIQSWRARGDMYHVGAVLNLFPQLKVILYDLPAPGGIANSGQFERERERADRWEQACMIADYYSQPDRVFYTRSEGVAAKASKGHAYDFKNKVASGAGAEELQGLFIDVGGCTTVLGLDMMEARKGGPAAYGKRKQELAQAVAPDPKEGDGRATADEITHYLATHGWEDGKKYVIINFRDSGHSFIQKKIAKAQPEDRTGVKKGYDPVRDQIGGNHPDLDTGTEGIKQLGQLVTARGFTPVYMGEEPSDAAQPHLISYWKFKHVYGEPPAEKELCRGGRAAEAFFIRTIADNYDVRLLAMRSGVTDQLALLGIPTISIDVDNFHQAPVPELSKTPGYQMGDDETAHSWARGTKLEAGLERDYGRVFLEESRPLGNRDAEGNYQEDTDNFDAKGKWKGKFGETDLANIDDAIGFYFGTNDEAAPESNGVRHKSHPFHPEKMQKTDEEGDSEALHGASIGKIDTGLNPETVLGHMRSVLGAQPPKVDEAVRFADSQLSFMEDGKSAIAPKDIEHRASKLAQRRTFLGSVVALLQPHGAHGKFKAELDELAGLSATNSVRRLRLEEAVAGLRNAIRFAGISRDDKKVVAYLSRMDAVDLGPIDSALAAAKAACGVERADVHALRFGPIANLVQAAHTTFTSAVADGLEEHAELSYYGRRFVIARDLLKQIAW